MHFRLTVFLAFVAAALGLLIAFWDRDDDKDRRRLENVRRAFRFDPARVERLRIDTSDLAIECRRDGLQWQLVRPVAARADPVAIERLLGALQELPRGEIILPPRRAPDAYAPYGLDQPAATLSLISGTATNRILVGRLTPLGDGVYVRQSEHAGLVRIATTLLDLIPASAASLRDRSLLAGAPADIQRLDIRTPAGYIQLVRDEHGDWRIFQPFTARADAATLSALVEKLLACAVVRFVQDAASDLSPYGLDSRTAVTAVLNTDSGNGSQMLAFGDVLPDDPDLCYARLQAETSIYAVPRAARDALLVKPDDLRDRRVPGAEPDALRRISIEEAAARLEFHRAEDGAWQLAAPLRAPAEAGAVEDLLRSWSDVRLVDFEIPSPTNPPREFVRTIRLEPLDASRPVTVLRLGPCPGRADAAGLAIEGESSLAVASPARLLDFPLNPLLYRSRDILSIPADDIAGLRFAAAGRTLQVDRDPATDQWVPGSVQIGPVLACLAPLRAETLLPPAAADGQDDGFDPPALTVTVLQRGQRGLATSLLIGGETSPGGPRRAKVRGRDLRFTLPAATVAALRAPLAPETP